MTHKNEETAGRNLSDLSSGLSANAGLLLDFQDLGGQSVIPTGYNGFSRGGNWQVGTEGGNIYVFSADPSATIRRADGGLFSFEGADFAQLIIAEARSVAVQGLSGSTEIRYLTDRIVEPDIFHIPNHQLCGY